MVDIETEQNVIGAMMLYQECLNVGLADLAPVNFVDKVHKKLFEIIRDMYYNNQTVTDVTVYEVAKDLIRSNHMSWTTITDAFIQIDEFKYKVEKLKELTRARQLYQLAQKIVKDIERFEPVNEIIQSAENGIYAISTETKQEPIITPKEQAMRIIDTIEKRMNEEERAKLSIFTSFKPLNLATGGFEAGDLIIVSGPTGGGKTAFTMNLIRDIAIMQKKPCLYINTEMSAQQMDLRWAAILSKDWDVTNTKLRLGEITQEQLGNLITDLNAMHQSELYSITIPDLTIPKMLSTIRRFAMQRQVRAVAVDYIGRMDLADNKDSREEWQLLLSAARKLKTIAQQYGLIVFMLSQADSQGKLALAKYMQHEADLHLHVRPINEDEKADCLTRMEWFWNYVISIEKGRSSPRGFIPVRFAGEKLTFISNREVAKKHAELAGEEQEQAPNQGTHGTKGYHSSKSGNRQKYYNCKS